jgi:hypothetical protein
VAFRFGSKTEPLSEEFTAAVEKLLHAPSVPAP